MSLERVSPSHSLLLVGCGKMGSALLAGWQAAGVLADFNAIYVVDPSGQPMAGMPAHVKLLHSLSEITALPNTVLLAVKPQILEQVLPQFAGYSSSPDQLYITIAAGKQVEFYRQYLGQGAKIIRAMPNTPSTVGQGMTGLYTDHASADDKARAGRLFQAVGKILWLHSEEEMHALTAVSGSGPAYVFYIVECWVKAAESLGFPAPVALELVQQTLAGSVRMLEEGSASPAALKIQVTSPGGTTQAALESLQQNRMDSLWKEALAAAVARSKELAQKN